MTGGAINADLASLLLARWVETTSEKASRQLSDSLVRHGVEAEIDVSVLSEGSISGALMRSLTDNNCNLLVMGCYGHSHFREIVLGGASRDMLRDLSIPVLMAH
jgi:nucleotide-binding universal stress UspA family protein